jgi:hypothetical protein
MARQLLQQAVISIGTSTASLIVPMALQCKMLMVTASGTFTASVIVQTAQPS